MGKGAKNLVIPIVSEKSTFAELTKFLVYSYFEKDHELVEKILVNREKCLIDELDNFRKKCHFLENEKNGVEKKMDFLEKEKNELEKERNGFEKRLNFELENAKNGFEKMLNLELEKERNGFEKRLDFELKNAKNEFEKMLKIELEKEKNGFEKRLDFELEKEKNEFEKKLSVELEKEKNGFEKRLNLELEKERDRFKKRSNFEFEKVVETESDTMMKKKLSLVFKEKSKVDEVFEKLRGDDCDVFQKVRNGFEKELKIERELMDKKLFLVNLEKLKVEDEFEKYRRDVEERLRAIAKPDVIEKSLTLDEGESNQSYGMMLRRERDVMENKLSLALFEKLRVEDEFERCRRELGEKIKILERENGELRRKIELLKEGDLEQVEKIRANREKGLIDEAESRQRESEDRVGTLERENGELRKIEVHKEGDHEQVQKIIANREKGLTDETESRQRELEDRVGILERKNGELKREIELLKEGDLEQVEKIRANREKGLTDEAESRQRESEDIVGILERKNGELKRAIELCKEGDREQVEKIRANREKSLTDEDESRQRESEDRVGILERENGELKREIELRKEDDHEQVEKIQANREKGLINEAESRERVELLEGKNGELRQTKLHKEGDHQQVDKIMANREKNMMDEAAERGRREFEDKVGISKRENGELKRETELHEERLCKRIKLEGKDTGFSSPDPSSIYCSAKSRNPESYKTARNVEFRQSKIHSDICLDKYEVSGSEQSSKTFAEVDNKCSEAIRSGDSRSGKGTSWKTPADMISTLRNDPEFCLRAVCALYRQHISAGKSTGSIGFRSFDIASGTEAAKYLINDDPTNNLSRSVSEVEQDRPSTFETCWRLAIKYLTQLFDIHQKKLDPFFCQEA